MVQIFEEECDTYEGGLYINIGFSDPVGTVNPDIQSSLDLLGLGNMSYIGLLHLSIGGAGQRVLKAFDILPNLQVAQPSRASFLPLICSFKLKCGGANDVPTFEMASPGHVKTTNRCCSSHLHELLFEAKCASSCCIP